MTGPDNKEEHDGGEDERGEEDGQGDGGRQAGAVLEP